VSAHWYTVSLSLTLAILTATSTACGPKRVTVGGVEMSYDDGARTLVSQGVEAERKGDSGTAKARYQEVVNNYGGAPSEPDALAALGLLLHREGGCGPARAYLERLAVEHPGHPRAAQAKALLNDCPAAGASPTAASSAAAEVLSTYERRFGEASSPAAKREVASAAADAALAAGDGAAAVRWLLRVRDQEPEPAQRAALEAELREVVDQHVSFVDVRRLVETLPEHEFPRPLLLYKLGRIQYHVRDYAGAQESLGAYLEDEPNGAYAAGAKSLLARMAALAQVKPTRVGVLLPMSGKHRSYGELALQTIRLALGVDKNDRGAGLELVVRDTKSDGVVAAQMAESLVVDEHVVAILGPIFSYAAVPAGRVAQQLGTPILTISTADELPTLGPYVFRNALTNRDQVEALVDYAMSILQMRTFAVLYPRHPYGEEMLQLFWDAVERRKGEIRGVESYAMTDTTFTTQVKRLVARDVLALRGDFRRAEQECDRQPDSYRKARCKDEVKKNLKPIVDFDGLFIPDYPKTIPMLSAALAFEDIIVETDARRLRIIEKTLGRKVKPVTLMGGSGWNSAQVPERSGRNVENALFTDGFFPEADDKAVAEFVNAYQKAYRRTPRLYPEALFWDSARMLGQVIRTQRPGSREALRAALSALSDFPGVSGKTSFGGTNDAKRPVRILTIKDGRIQDVPDPDAPPDGGAPTEAPAETPTETPTEP
jgi:branched-chain amino acid transport system substrate-binding protein